MANKFNLTVGGITIERSQGVELPHSIDHRSVKAVTKI
jgi:hypothetical protein